MGGSLPFSPPIDWSSAISQLPKKKGRPPSKRPQRPFAAFQFQLFANQHQLQVKSTSIKFSSQNVVRRKIRKSLSRKLRRISDRRRCQRRLEKGGSKFDSDHGGKNDGQIGPKIAKKMDKIRPQNDLKYL